MINETNEVFDLSVVANAGENYCGDNKVFDEGLELILEHISVIPQHWERDENGEPAWKEDGDSAKKKCVRPRPWKRWQTEVMSEDEFISDWNYRRANTLSLMTGPVNNNYGFDFDQDSERIFPAFLKKVIGNVIDRDEVHIHKTISNGYHFIVKVERRAGFELPGNTVYAEAAEGGKPLIESRGTGGLLFIAPSYGYTVVPGFCPSLAELPEISVEQFRELEAIAMSFNELVEERPTAHSAPRNTAERATSSQTPVQPSTTPSEPFISVKRPGDDYNERATMESMTELLVAHGWAVDHEDSTDENIHFTRPGKSGGTSATLRLIEGMPIFYVFSSSCKEFEPEAAYNPYSVYTKLEHNNDFTQSARALSRIGFGTAPAVGSSDDTRIVNGLEFKVDKKGNICNDLTAVVTILNEDPLYAGMAKINDLSYMPELVKQVGPFPVGTRFSDALMSYIILDINNRYERLRISLENLKIALYGMYNDSHFNPFKDFVDSCEWDGKKRVETLLIDAFGVEDTVFAREAITKWLLAAYARQIKPGMKFDYTLSLPGGEGKGKSTFLKVLFDPLDLGDGGWNVDGMNLSVLVDDKRFIEGAMGKVGIELAEFAGSRHVEVEELKSALTKTSWQLRMAYGRGFDRFLARHVFMINTNNEEFLQSQTGNRRFWILKARTPNFELLTEDYVKQVWGEVKAIYESLCDDNGVFHSKQLLLSPEAEKLAFEAQQHARTKETWEGAVARKLGTVRLYTDIEEVEDGIKATPVYAEKDVVAEVLWRTTCVTVTGSDEFKGSDGRKLKAFVADKLGWEKGTAHIGTTRASGYVRPKSDYAKIFIPKSNIPLGCVQDGHIEGRLLGDYVTAPQYWPFS